MGFQTGSYSNQNELLNLFAAWAVANGWTQNLLTDDSFRYGGDTFTGRRLHLQKTINGTDCYFNLRSTSNQRVYSYSGYDAVTGICVNGSTGFDSGQSWDTQPGYTPYYYGQSTSSGGCVDAINETGGAYTFYAQDDSLSMQILSQSTWGDNRFLTIGCTSLGAPIYSASGGTSNEFSTTNTYDDRSAYMGRSGGDGIPSAGAAVLLTAGWHVLDTYYTTGVSRRLKPLVDVNGTGAGVLTGASSVSPSIAYSPEPFRGNAPLPVFAPVVSQGSSSEFYPVGVLSSIRFINMTNYSNGEEITVGSDTYKMYRIFNPNPSGVAFKV